MAVSEGIMTTQYTDGSLPDPPPDGQLNILVITGQPRVKMGNVGIIIYNCPISDIGQGYLGPAIQLSAQQAMEVGMNLIYIAKVAEAKAAAAAESA